MNSRAVLLAVILLAIAVPATAQKLTFYTRSSSKTDLPPAKSDAASVGSHLEFFAAQALEKRFPCSTTTTSDDTRTMLRFQQMKDLLGAGGDSDAAIANIASALGARYVVSFNVVESNGSYNISAMMQDIVTAKTIARKTEGGIKVDGPVGDQLDAFAKAFVGGIDGPKCPGVWKGTITITDGGDTNATDSSWTLKGTFTASCQVEGSQGNCTARRTIGGSGAKGFAMESVEEGKGTAVITMTRQAGQISLTIAAGDFDGTTTMAGPKGSMSLPGKMSMGTWHAEGPVAKEPDKEAGRWSDGKGLTITWSLSR